MFDCQGISTAIATLPWEQVLQIWGKNTFLVKMTAACCCHCFLALLRLHNDINEAMEQQKVVLLVMLDLSAAKSQASF